MHHKIYYDIQNVTIAWNWRINWKKNHVWRRNEGGGWVRRHGDIRKDYLSRSGALPGNGNFHQNTISFMDQVYFNGLLLHYQM